MHPKFSAKPKDMFLRQRKSEEAKQGLYFFFCSAEPHCFPQVHIHTHTHTVFCCVRAFLDNQDESLMNCAKLPWSEADFGFFHTEPVSFFLPRVLCKTLPRYSDLMRLDLKCWKHFVWAHNKLPPKKREELTRLSVCCVTEPLNMDSALTLLCFCTELLNLATKLFIH